MKIVIFNIQKCSIHDGEGLRTVVFFKGCPLRCPWCANPESQQYRQEIMELPSRCIGCGACKKKCKNQAIGADLLIIRDRCKHCFDCVECCYAEAKKVIGSEYTIEELFNEIEKDKQFYEIFGGGVTFSGGEPLSHGKYLEDICRKCHENEIHVTIESCGHGDFSEFAPALTYIDSAFIDIKVFDSQQHKALMGMDNALILSNIRKISEMGIPTTIRTPIVPGYTDSWEYISAIARYVLTLDSVQSYELLPYHNLGESKYKSMGIEYKLRGIEPPSDETMRDLVKRVNEIFTDSGKACFWVKDNNKEVIK